jgi:integrase
VLAAALRKLAAADRTRAPGTSLRAFGARVLDERAKELPRSAGAERTRWKRIVEADFIDDPIDTITPPAVDRWARRLVQKRPGSARCTLTLLSTICGRAVREGLIKANPCADIRVRLPTRTHDPWTYLLPAEQVALVSAPIPETDALQIGCLLGTGVRVGELFALRLSDVHAFAAEPHIVIRFGSPNGPPKGKKIRRVPLFGLGLRSFERWLEVLPTWCPHNPNKLAFPGQRGGFQGSGELLVFQKRVNRKRTYVNRFQEALTAAGIEPANRHDGRPVRVHDLRHTFAASLVSGWWGEEPWRLEDLCAVMGHSSITITERYAHLAPGRVRELAGRTPGLALGEGSASQVAIHAKKAAPIALLPAAQEGTRCSSHSGMISGTSATSNPSIGLHAAVAGLRALATGDEDAAREHALRLFCGGEPTALRLAETFEAYLTSEHNPARKSG